MGMAGGGERMVWKEKRQKRTERKSSDSILQFPFSLTGVWSSQF